MDVDQGQIKRLPLHRLDRLRGIGCLRLHHGSRGSTLTQERAQAHARQSFIVNNQHPQHRVQFVAPSARYFYSYLENAVLECRLKLALYIVQEPESITHVVECHAHASSALSRGHGVRDLDDNAGPTPLR